MTNQEAKFYLFKILNRDICSLSSSTSCFTRNKIYYFVNKLPTLTEQTLNTFLNSYNALKNLIWQKVMAGEVDRKLASSITTNIKRTVNLLNIMANNDLSTAVNNTFAIIGVSSIALNSDPSSSDSGLNIILNNGVRINTVTSGNYSRFVYLVTDIGQEYFYSLKSFPYYNFDNLTLQNFSDLPSLTGVGKSYFTFGEGNNRNKVTIGGEGRAGSISTAVPNKSENYFPSSYSSVDTLIFEPTIDKLENGTVLWAGETSALSKSFQIKTIVIKRPANLSLTLDSGWIPSGKSTANPKPTFDIYSDHPAVSAYSYSSNITVNIHPLSEWGG